MKPELTASSRMSKSISELCRRQGMMQTEYKQHPTKSLQNGKYWDIAICTASRTGEEFEVNHFGEIFQAGKPVYFRKQYNKPTVKIAYI